MPLSFLVPAFLAGLIAIAIPIWVHLRNRPHADAMDFPSLMFLERVPQRSVQRQTLRNRSLLAMRMLALAIIALAFARPFFAGDSAPSVLASGSREVVVLLDRSWSMSYGDRWTRAIEAVRERLAALTGSDRVSLVMFDTSAEVVVAQSDGAAVAAALGAMSPGDGTTDLAAGLRAAGEILTRSELPRREIVLVSDFQRRGWSASAEVSLPPDVAVRAVPIFDAAPVNASIADVVLRPAAGDPGRLTVSARLTRSGGEAPLLVPVVLEVDGAVVQQVEVELPATGAAQAVFSDVDGSDGLVATVRLPRDRLGGDDSFHVSAAAARPLRVQVLENPTANETDSFYVQRALAVGSAPPYRVDREALGDLRDAALAPADVVILNDVGELDAGGSATLRRYVEGGGGLLIILGEQTDRLESTAATASLLPFAPSEVVDRSADLGATMAFIDSDHPALEIFAARGGSELAAARTYRYRTLRPEPESGVLLRFDDGRAALVEVVLGEGRVLVWTSTIDGFWTDLPLRPVYVPLIHEAVQYAAGYREPPLSLPADTPTAAATVAIAAGAPSVGVTRILIDDAEVGDGARLSPGIRRVAWETGAGNGAGHVAVNLDRSEADLSTIDAEEVVAAIIRDGAVATAAADAATSGEGRVERRQSLWWYLLVLAFVALAVETALSNRLSPRAS